MAWQLHPQWHHSFGAKSALMLVKVQSTLLSGKKQSGSRVPENFGGVLIRRLAFPLKLKQNRTAALCQYFFRDPGRPTNNRAVKCGSGKHGEVSFTPNNMVAFPGIAPLNVEIGGQALPTLSR
jgi:hypothetical protein